MMARDDRRWWAGFISLVEQRIEGIFRDRYSGPVYDPKYDRDAGGGLTCGRCRRVSTYGARVCGSCGQILRPAGYR